MSKAEVSSDRGKGGRPVSVLKCMGKKVTESHEPSVFNAWPNEAVTDAQAFAKYPTLTLKSQMILWLGGLLRSFNHVNHVAQSQTRAFFSPLIFLLLTALKGLQPRSASAVPHCRGSVALCAEGRVLEAAKHSTNHVCMVVFFPACQQIQRYHGESLWHYLSVWVL